MGVVECDGEFEIVGSPTVGETEAHELKVPSNTPPFIEGLS